jgi:hypothetical protein
MAVTHPAVTTAAETSPLMIQRLNGRALMVDLYARSQRTINAEASQFVRRYRSLREWSPEEALWAVGPTGRCAADYESPGLGIIENSFHSARGLQVKRCSGDPVPHFGEMGAPCWSPATPAVDA